VIAIVEAVLGPDPPVAPDGSVCGGSG